MSNFRLLLLLSCALLLSRSLVPQEPAWAQERSPSSDLIETQLGDLPIILSAPHDGARDIPQAKPRSGEGLEAKPGGFVTARDTGTAPLALAIASALEKRLHRKPYVVVNRAHRKFMDPNRSPSEAFEEPATQSVYEEYHRFLTDACQQVRQKFRTGLLLDIHGQGSRKDTVFRGTKNGLTVQLLRNRFGESAHSGDESFFAMLANRKLTVFPNPFDGGEQAGFTGGFIVNNYGSHTPFAIDAMQLEFGGLYRAAENRDSAAAAIADAIIEYANKYLGFDATTDANPSEPIAFNPKRNPAPDAKPITPINLDDPDAIDIALYLGEGASQSRNKVLATLKSIPKVRVHDRSPEDIQEGKLKGIEVLLHPGGSGGGQGRALGESGRQAVRDFVADGGGFIGICAGAYLATCDYEWSLNILDARVVDRAHWARGTGKVEIEFDEKARTFFTAKQPRGQVWYANGPLLAPAENASIPDFESLAKYAGEISKEGIPKGVMPGTTAIARGVYSNGRVICFSCHPESSEGLQSMLEDAVDWVRKK